MVIPDIEVQKHPDYRTINVNGIGGNMNNMYLEMVVFTDEQDLEKSLGQHDFAIEKSVTRRTIQIRMIMDPYQAQSTLIWLQRHLENYKKLYGSIPSPEELQNRANTKNKGE